MRIATIFTTVFTAMLLAIAGADRTAFAASLCSSAQLPAEQTVCTDPQLALLDDQYVAEFDSVLAQLHNQADHAKQIEVRDRARSFLTRRNACEASTECIRQSYQDILQYFSTVQTASADSPSDTGGPATSGGVATASPRALSDASGELARPETEDDSTLNQGDNTNDTRGLPSDVGQPQSAQEHPTDPSTGLSASDEPTPDSGGTRPHRNSTSASAPRAADTPLPPTVAEASSISSPVSNARIETILLLLILAAIVIYVLPSLIAFSCKHPNRWPILVINIAAGITFFGWLVALVWACVEPPVTGGEVAGGKFGEPRSDSRIA
jgi:uncharacterized protein